MNTTTPHPTDGSPHSATPRPNAPDGPDSASSDHSTWGEVFTQSGPLIGATLYGPPYVLLLGPWLLLVLLLIGPFAVIVTVLLALAIAASLLAACALVLASPYLLIRHLRNHTTDRAKLRAPKQMFRNHRVSVGPLGSPQPRGMS